MARRVQVTLVDDIDGSEAVETVPFALDGTAYEIDLSKRNAAALRKAMADYLANARRAGRMNGSRRASSGSKARAGHRDPQYLEQVRAWARDNGYEVKPRGRIPASVMAHYVDAVEARQRA